MVITDILYDLTIGIVGAVAGAFVVGLLSRIKTRRLSRQIIISQRDLDSVRLENNRLLETIKMRENQILELQKQMLKKQGGKK